MDIDKIVKQYKLMLILRPILKFLEISILWIILPFIITILTSEKSKSDVPIILYVLIFLGYISLISIDGRDLDKYTPPAFLTERFFSNYMKKWGMTESEVEEYVRIYQKKEEAEQKRKRYLKEEKRILANASKKFVSPIIHRLCIMNLDAREAQEQFLKEVYSADKTKEVFETEFTDSQFNEAILYWKKKDFSDKKMFVNYLYKFTILADGIHKDEWNFMISLMSQLRFSKSFIEYFTYRYYALRTEFEDSKSKHGEEGSSTTQQSDTNLDSYYSILGVSSDASYEEVRKAYHSLALTHHPDLPKNAGRIQECEDLMIKFNEAYNKIIKN
jgi:hypothetical protein